MEWRDEAAAELPSPDPDEPASLRRDILDELSDHLTCAVDGELARGENDDEEAAHRRALDRFGDPVRLARRLWFDAMKGRLMLQKVTTAFAAVAAVAAIVGFALLWSAVDSAQDAFQAGFIESEKANAELLQRLEKLSAKVEQGRSLEWVPLKFRLVLGEDGSKPAVGYEVDVRGELYKGGSKEVVQKLSDERGVVDFGLVRPGVYYPTISDPQSLMIASCNFALKPGDDAAMTIRCPDVRIESADVKLEAQLPADLAGKGCAVVAAIDLPRMKVGETNWVLRERQIGSELYVIQNDMDSEFLGNARSRVSTSHRIHLGYPIYGSGDWTTLPYRLSYVAIIPQQENLVQRRQVTDVPLLDVVNFEYNDAPTFTPKPGEDNVWKITLPSEMIKNARERLKKFDERAKRVKQAGKV